MRSLLSPDNRLLTLARSGQRLPPVWLALLLGTVGLFTLLIIGTLLGAVTANTLLPGYDAVPASLRAAVGQDVLLIVSFGVLLLALWGWVWGYEGRGFASLGFASPFGGARYGRGFLLGAASFAAAVGLLAAPGLLRTEGDGARNGFAGVAALGPVLLVLPGWLVQGAAEEIVTRGWLMNVIAVRSRPWVGVAAAAAVFGLMHSLNPGVNPFGVLNTVLVGVFLALYALTEGGLWGVCAWHSAWNWVQGNVFGLSVSGVTPLGGAVVDFATVGPDWFTGGAYGVEAGAAATVVLLLGIAVILLVARGRSG